MSNHTPGPWVADDQEGYGDWGIWSRMAPTGHGTPGRWIATVHGDSAETDANAHLIESAPDLLANLKFAVSLLLAIPAIGGSAQVKYMQSVIAKAEGRR